MCWFVFNDNGESKLGNISQRRKDTNKLPAVVILIKIYWQRLGITGVIINDGKRYKKELWINC